MDSQKMFAYHQWASQKVLELVQDCGEEYYTKEGLNSFPSIRETIRHVIGVEKLWFQRINGVKSPEFTQFDVETVDQAKQAIMLLHAEMELYFATLSEESWQEELDYRNMKGQEFHHSREEMLFTLVNHASYHRGQITSFLRQFGKVGIPLDYIYFQKQNR
ncbi:DinB family protein [Planococcus maritimus]|uniref:DinB family protein n=1 Tax=Planococcus maritimus TaxID=192421 RepID=UPI003139EE0C